MLKLKMNDTSVVNINSGVVPTTVDVKGVPTKALKIEISAEEMDVTQIKEVFGSELATSEMSLLAADGSTASVHSNFTNLRSIAYDVDNDVYTVIIAKESDIPTMIANLETSVDNLLKRVEESDNSVKAQYESVVEDTTKAVESLKKDLGEIGTKVEDLASTSKDVEDLKKNVGEIGTKVDDLSATVTDVASKVNTPSQGNETEENTTIETPSESTSTTDESTTSDDASDTTDEVTE